MAKIKPYKGKEPYIFISYSHRDMDQALDLIGHLESDGYRIWYDEGIDPGTEWDEYIAEHIEKCSMFIALMSNNYMSSDNCKDELNFARDLNLPRLLIYMEETELTSGMRMRLNRLQAIHKYTYEDMNTFYEKVNETEGIETCRKQKASPATAPAEEKKAAAETSVKKVAAKPRKAPARAAVTPKAVIKKEPAVNAPDLTNKGLSSMYGSELKKLRNIFKDSLTLTASSRRTIVMGSFPQGPFNEVQPLEWIVLEEEKDRMLLLSKNILDCSGSVDMGIPYDRLLHYLNDEFLRTSFDASERNSMLYTCHDNLLTLCTTEHILPLKEINSNLYPINRAKIITENTDIENIISAEFRQSKGHTLPKNNKDLIMGMDDFFQDKIFVLSSLEVMCYFPSADTRTVTEPVYPEHVIGKYSSYRSRKSWRTRDRFRGLGVVNHEGLLSGNHDRVVDGGIRPAVWVRK